MIAEGQCMVARPNAELASLLSSSTRKGQNGLAPGATDGDSQATLEDVPDDGMSNGKSLRIMKKILEV